MKKNIAVLFVFISLQLFSQDPSPSTFINRLNADYKDIAVFKNNIYAITTCDSLVVWSIEKDSIIAIQKDINNIVNSGDYKIIASSVSGNIYSYSEPFKRKKDTVVPHQVYYILTDSENTSIFLTSKGIYYKGQLFRPGKNSIPSSTPYMTRSRIENKLWIPNVAYVDKKNRVWLAYNYGEFGANLCFFDLESKTYIEKTIPKISFDATKTFREQFKPVSLEKLKETHPDSLPKSLKIIDNEIAFQFPTAISASENTRGITEDSNGSIYTTESLQHFDISGSIKVYTEKSSDFYTSNHLPNIPEQASDTINNNGKQIIRNYTIKYLGPITFNPYNKTLYYHSNLGFFKLHKNSDNTYSKELVLKPKLTYSPGLSNSVGYQLAVQKMIFIDANRFVFLTNKNGIGYYDGYQTKYYK